MSDHVRPGARWAVLDRRPHRRAPGLVHPAGWKRQLEAWVPRAAGRGHRARVPGRCARRRHSRGDRRTRYLAALDLKKATFTTVGYGLDGYITGSLLANHPLALDDGIRSYRDVSVITLHDAFPDRFLKITASVCFGDSGGPLFHNGTVVALNTWTFSTRCTGPNLEYRTDLPRHRGSS